ncbi:hypothetical protein IWQ60_005258 [Tieghemiomyces parasiticus]|uniref:UBC core domain-containing protein n=1 Tax=Tieghemiomyces parasiticus TaxID=78921 RepID=A0A9W8A6M2_9FUNG|nr:hypothetical protein IWQ60_005258 [Tieghemiomyces parasiticus]
MDCSDSYPFKAPKVKVSGAPMAVQRVPLVLFKTRIYHPNVDYESGEVCLSLTREGSWKPTIKVADLIEDIAHLIDNPNLDTPLIESAAKLYTSNRQEYDANAKEWTKLYAQTY